MAEEEPAGRLCLDGLGIRRVSEVPEGVEALSLGDNRLRDLGPIPSCSGLLELNLAGNQLDEAAVAPLASLPALRELDISRNLLRHLGPLFPAGARGFPCLESLDVSSNAALVEVSAAFVAPQLKTFMACGLVSTTLTCLSCPTLELLDLRGSCLQEVSGLALLPSLRSLLLDGNALLNASQGTLLGHARLDTLGLARNAITSLAPPSLPSLTSLDASGNSLQELPDLVGLPSLTSLSLPDNDLAMLSTPLCALRRLTFLDVSRNHIASLDMALSYAFRRLQVLLMAGNELQRPEDVLAVFASIDGPALRHLDLRENPVSLAFYPCPALLPLWTWEATQTSSELDESGDLQLDSGTRAERERYRSSAAAACPALRSLDGTLLREVPSSPDGERRKCGRSDPEEVLYATPQQSGELTWPTLGPPPPLPLWAESTAAKDEDPQEHWKQLSLILTGQAPAQQVPPAEVLQELAGVSTTDATAAPDSAQQTGEAALVAPPIPAALQPPAFEACPAAPEPLASASLPGASHCSACGQVSRASSARSSYMSNQRVDTSSKVVAARQEEVQVIAGIHKSWVAMASVEAGREAQCATPPKDGPPGSREITRSSVLIGVQQSHTCWQSWRGDANSDATVTEAGANRLTLRRPPSQGEAEARVARHHHPWKADGIPASTATPAPLAVGPLDEPVLKHSVWAAAKNGPPLPEAVGKHRPEEPALPNLREPSVPRRPEPLPNPSMRGSNPASARARSTDAVRAAVADTIFSRPHPWKAPSTLTTAAAPTALRSPRISRTYGCARQAPSSVISDVSKQHPSYSAREQVFGKQEDALRPAVEPLTKAAHATILAEGVQKHGLYHRHSQHQAHHFTRRKEPENVAPWHARQQDVAGRTLREPAVGRASLQREEGIWPPDAISCKGKGELWGSLQGPMGLQHCSSGRPQEELTMKDAYMHFLDSEISMQCSLLELHRSIRRTLLHPSASRPTHCDYSREPGQCVWDRAD